MDHKSLRDELIGAWSLVSYEDRPVDVPRLKSAGVNTYIFLRPYE